MRFLDMHTHLPMEGSAAWRSWSTCEVVRTMDRCGVERAVVMTLDGFAGEQRHANDLLSRVGAESGGRLVPFGTVDPRRPDAAGEVRRCSSELGCRAIKLHPWLQGFSPLESYMDPVAAAAIETGLPLVFHDGTPPYSSPLQIAHLAGRFPELIVVLAHGGLFDMWQDAVAAALRYPNVHITLCGTAPLGVFRRIIDMVGTAKLSMGTDSGYGSGDVAEHRLAVHRMLLAEAEPAAADAMAHGNAERLLGL